MILPLGHILQRSEEEQGAECTLGLFFPWHKEFLRADYAINSALVSSKAALFSKSTLFARRPTSVI